jgi:peroxiredoxin
MALNIRVGDPIPSVGLRATDGYLLNLRTFVTKQPAAFLFFGAPTLKGAARRRGLAAARALAEGHRELTAAGIAVVGVSCDSEEQQTDFVAAEKLPFLLFSDERRTAVEMLGIQIVAEERNVNVARPVVIAVDRDGFVRAVIEKDDPETLVYRILKALAEPMPAAALSQPRAPTAGS